MKKTCFVLLFFVTFSLLSFIHIFAQSDDYKVGIGDILEVRILKPEASTDRTTVTPSGQISVAYIGSLHVKDKTITEVQKEIQWRLASGYLKYPVVVVALIESRSMNFTVSGEVIRPGSYQLQEKTTVLKAISIAGGFTRFGSKSRVKLLRPFPDKPGYDSIKINLQKAMNGDAKEDVILKPGDIVVVSEGFF
ncbi:MAG: polysaccharide export protein [Spirochaetes bacterium]|nr:polysaccharide export protein [Spirochaetota bacterium]